MGAKGPRKIRRDATLKGLRPGDPRREQIAAWLEADGWQSCAQQCFSQLGFATKGKPVSRDLIYTAVKFWAHQDRYASVLERATNQAALEAKQKGLTVAQQEEATDRYFVAMAAESETLDEYKEMRLLRIRDQEAKGNARIASLKIEQGNRRLDLANGQLEVAQRRVSILEANQARAKEHLEAVKKTGGLSPEALKTIEEAAKLL